MSKRTHMAFGLLLASLLLRTEMIPFIPVVLLASMLPDLDLLLSGLPFIEHRKTFHNIWFLVFVHALAIRFLPEVSPFISVGIFSHFIMDSLTKRGVMWLYPLSKRKLRGPLRAGGTFDKLLFLVFMLIFGYITFNSLLGF